MWCAFNPITGKDKSVPNLLAFRALKDAESESVVAAHAFNPITGRRRQADLWKFEASLVYRASSKAGSKATEKPCLKKIKAKRRWT